jgi:predicted HTH domain antitoxin
MSVRLELNDDIRDALRIPPEEQEGCLRRKLALSLYEKELLPLGKARQVAGMENGIFFY